MPTADFCCGAECGISTAGAVSDLPANRHWMAIAGVGPTVQSTFARNGGSAYRFNPANADISNIRHDTAGTENTRWFRGYVYFNSLATDAIISHICRFRTVSGLDGSIAYKPSAGALVGVMGGNQSVATFPVTTGVWYRIEMALDVSGATAELSWTVNGVDKGTVTNVQTATTINALFIGAQCSGATATNGDVIWDDVITGTNIATDYPVGAGQVAGLFPNADGTHSFSVAGDFVYNAAGGNVATDATDTWSFVDHPMGSVSDFMNAALAGTGEYLEWQFQDLPAGVGSINGLELVSAHHAASTTANLQSGRLVDGGTVNDAWLDRDFSQTSMVYNTKHYAVAPSSSAAWTKAKVDALKFRWGSSWTAADVSPDAYIDGIVLEVDYVPSGAATRFYFTQGVAAAISPAIDAGWEQQVSTFIRNRLVLTKTESSGLTHSAQFGSSSTSDTAWGQWISPPLAGNVTINTPVSLVMRCQEGSISENAHLAFALRVVSQDGSTVRGTLKTQYATATEFATSGATRSFNALTTTSVAALAGDRLVMEVGVHGVTPANVDPITLEYGANSLQPDHALADGDVNSYNAWFEIGQALTFDPEPFTGTINAFGDFVSSMAAAGTLKFNGTMAATSSISSSMNTDAIEIFTGVMNATKTLGSALAAAGNQIFTGILAGTKALVSSMTAAGTNVNDGVGPPPTTKNRGQSRRPSIRFIDEAPPPEPKKKRPRPAPIPAEELPALERSLPSLAEMEFDPENWHRMSRFRFQGPQLEPERPTLPEAPIEARLEARLIRELGLGDTHDPQKFLEQFLRQLGMEI